mgnify:CR=1 FL=1
MQLPLTGRTLRDMPKRGCVGLAKVGTRSTEARNAWLFVKKEPKCDPLDANTRAGPSRAVPLPQCTLPQCSSLVINMRFEKSSFLELCDYKNFTVLSRRRKSQMRKMPTRTSTLLFELS